VRQARKGFTVRCFSGCRPGRAPQGSSACEGQFAPVQAGWMTDMQLRSGLFALLLALPPQEDRTGHGCVVALFKLARRAGEKIGAGLPSWLPTALVRLAGGCRFQGPMAVWSEDQPAATSTGEPSKGRQRRDGSRRSQLHDASGGGFAFGSAASASKPLPRVKPSMHLGPTTPRPLAPIVTRRAGIHAGELGRAAARQRRRAP